MSGAGKEQCGTPEEFRTADELASLVTVCAQGSPAATDARFAAGPSDGLGGRRGNSVPPRFFDYKSKTVLE